MVLMKNTYVRYICLAYIFYFRYYIYFIYFIKGMICTFSIAFVTRMHVTVVLDKQIYLYYKTS